MIDLEGRLAKIEKLLTEREDEHRGLTLRDLLPGAKARPSSWQKGDGSVTLASLVPNLLSPEEYAAHRKQVVDADAVIERSRAARVVEVSPDLLDVLS